MNSQIQPHEIHNDRASWLVGPAAKCSLEPTRAASTLAGRTAGLQVWVRARRRKCLPRDSVHAISTGDIFRNARGLCECERTAAMNSALRYMKRGELRAG